MGRQRGEATERDGRATADPPTVPRPAKRTRTVMPQKAWSAKRERQYVHIKERLLERGRSEPLAEESAARVVNKERAQHG